MKTLKQFLILCCMVYTTSCGIVNLVSCVAPAPPQPHEPPFPPPPVVNVEPQAPEDITFEIVEFDSQGHAGRTWEAESFTETDFPRTVTFTDKSRTIITLRGSYEIREISNSR